MARSQAWKRCSIRIVCGLITSRRVERARRNEARDRGILSGLDECKDKAALTAFDVL